jgi:catechol 2,3-dioxygenase-like lactoylglutathione lyase family enzyme
MDQRITHIALVVDDYDKAIAYFTAVLNFDLREDTEISPGKRWVIVAPKGSGTCSLLLAKASGDEQLKRVGDQTGGRVFLFLHTDNFKRDFDHLIRQQVEIVRGPSMEAYGMVAVFRDLYGNLWDLIEKR